MIGISYKHDTEQDERECSVVERPVRECVKLFNIEDTSLLDDIATVQRACQKILDKNKIISKDKVQTNLPGNNKRKRKTELEKLRIKNWSPPRGKRNQKTNSNLVFNQVKHDSQADIFSVNFGYEDISLLQLQSTESSSIFENEEITSNWMTDWKMFFEVPQEDFIDSVIPVTLL